jgi:hypothetical protein
VIPPEWDTDEPVSNSGHCRDQGHPVWHTRRECYLLIWSEMPRWVVLPGAARRAHAAIGQRRDTGHVQLECNDQSSGSYDGLEWVEAGPKVKRCRKCVREVERRTNVEESRVRLSARQVAALARLMRQRSALGVQLETATLPGDAVMETATIIAPGSITTWLLVADGRTVELPTKTSR